MEIFSITPIYIASLGLLLVALTSNVIRLRWKFKVSLGEGDQPQLKKAIRAHGNFCETAPFGVILLMTLELQNAGEKYIHLFAAMLLIGRLLHGIGLNAKRSVNIYRMLGMCLTVLSTLFSAITILLITFN